MTTYNEVNTNNLYIQSSINIAGDTGVDNYAITSVGSVPGWRRITGLISQYTDDSNDAQDMNGGSVVNISFNREVMNFANVKFTGSDFTFNDNGLYTVSFQALFSGAGVQSMISFFINGNQIYGNLTTQTDSTNSMFYMEYTFDARAGDVMTVSGEKINGGSNYLRYNPIYRTPVTQLTIERLF